MIPVELNSNDLSVASFGNFCFFIVKGKRHVSEDGKRSIQSFIEKELLDRVGHVVQIERLDVIAHPVVVRVDVDRRRGDRVRRDAQARERGVVRPVEEVLVGIRVRVERVRRALDGALQAARSSRSID